VQAACGAKDPTLRAQYAERMRQRKLEAAEEEAARLPPDWVAHDDPESGKVYYVHAVTKKTTWDLPTAQEAASAELLGELAAHVAEEVAADEDAGGSPAGSPASGGSPASAGRGSPEEVRGARSHCRLAIPFTCFMLGTSILKRQCGRTLAVPRRAGAVRVDAGAAGGLPGGGHQSGAAGAAPWALPRGHAAG
jgi:hypothetical protein